MHINKLLWASVGLLPRYLVHVHYYALVPVDNWNEGVINYGPYSATTSCL